jgi:hypothetical protein
MRKMYTDKEIIAMGYPKVMVEGSDVAEIWHHEDGFVANAYRWPAPGTRRIARRIEGGWILLTEGYDRKRSFGRGPRYAAKSAVGGHLRKYD